MQKENPSSIIEIDFKPSETLHPSPLDWRDQVIYFLLVDRFDDGKFSPPYNGKKNTKKRDAKLGNGIMGGTLKGIKKRLPYLKKLGITTLWLSPVFKNRIDEGGALHGYAIQHFLAIDPNFGTKDDLKELVRLAHKLGMYVILDIVINHTADNWAYAHDDTPTYSKDTRYPFGFWRAKHMPDAFDEDDAVWPAELQDPDCYSRHGSISNWFDDEEALHGDFFNLKDLDLSNQNTLETIIAIYKYWIVEADIDGYRVDTVKHVDNHPAVTFFNRIKEFAESVGKKNFLLFGEIVDDDATIATYVGQQKTQGERIQALDASLDFPLYFILEEVIKGFVSPARLRERYDKVRQMYPQSDGSDCLVTFLDNHDQMARPYRRFLHLVPDKQQVVLGIGYILTAPGIPSIYYGTEQGFDGGASEGPDQVNHIRECMFGGKWGAFGTQGMHFFNQKHPLYKAIAKIIHARETEPALRYGRCYFREISEDGKCFSYPELGYGMLAYSRIIDNQELVVVLNLRDTVYTNYVSVDKEITPSGTVLTNLFDKRHKLLVRESGAHTVMELTLPPHSMGIFKNVS
jgi:glycosidase